ncbi:MAG TPA: VWA domain-containing protein [Tepidisphaeraceae bacterium]|jgi:Ca-activated chloride channel family protein
MRSRSTIRVGRSAFSIVAGLIVACLAFGCDKPAANSGDQTSAEPKPAGPTVEVTFLYGSEKRPWINDVTESFNRSETKIADGTRIHVNAIPLGSGECIDDPLEGRRQADLVSPASLAFIKLGNAQSRVRSGHDLIGSTENLVLSPVVIAMWKPMAEALGWPTKPIGWGDVLALAQDPNGWAARGHPEWGRFKFGHTHPEYSNSGLITTFAIAYAATGKTAGLTRADVDAPHTAQFLAQIESAVPHYGSSTGFFADRMVENGPGYLSAAVLYESLVVDAARQHQNLQFPLVAIYPKEGTFWSDHPVGLVDREWVTPRRREAATIYMQYLLARPQQERALQYGFRPGDPGVPIGAPIVPANGVDPQQPRTTLEVPTPPVMNALVELWRREKKKANVVLVFDTSGSMQDENKLPNAKASALQLLSMLADADTISLLPFSSDMRWSGRNLSLATQRSQAVATINALIADGGTRLYDSIDAAYAYLVNHPQPDRISAVVVLTDGQDTESHLKLPDLLQRIRPDPERRPIRIFTIGYGSDADGRVLSAISNQTQAKFYKGTPQNIREVFKDIATFF